MAVISLTGLRVERLANSDVRITLFDNEESGAKQYERLFQGSGIRTKSVCMGSIPMIHINLTGKNNSNILIRLIPGEGTDILEEDVTEAGGRTNVKVYDTYKGLKSNISSATKINYSDDRKIHRYDREAFQYNVTAPLLTGGFNPDDGVFLGGGVMYIRHGFRKSPYASMHRVSAKHSLLTYAFLFNAENSFTEAMSVLLI